ncbi:MAG: hypothetical protein V4850_16295 [Myxococcota bacterium]
MGPRSLAAADALIPDALVDTGRVVAYVANFLSAVERGAFRRGGEPVPEAMLILAEDMFVLSLVCPDGFGWHERRRLTGLVADGAAGAWLDSGNARVGAIQALSLSFGGPQVMPMGMPHLLLNPEIDARGRLILYLALSGPIAWSAAWREVTTLALAPDRMYADLLVLLHLSMRYAEKDQQWRWCNGVAGLTSHAVRTYVQPLLAGNAVSNPLYEAARSMVFGGMDAVAQRVHDTPLLPPGEDGEQLSLLRRHHALLRKRAAIETLEAQPFFRPTFCWGELRPFDPDHPADRRRGH